MYISLGLLFLPFLMEPGPVESAHYAYKYPGMANDNAASRSAIKAKYTSVPAECNCSACKLLPPGCDCDTCAIFPPTSAPTVKPGGDGDGDGGTTEGGGKKDDGPPIGTIAGATAGAAVGVAAAAAALRYATRPPPPVDATFEGDEAASAEEQDREVVARQESADFAG